MATFVLCSLTIGLNIDIDVTNQLLLHSTLARLAQIQYPITAPHSCGYVKRHLAVFNRKFTQDKS